MSPDGDMKQLLQPGVKLLRETKRAHLRNDDGLTDLYYTEANFVQQYGFSPSAWVDVRSLMGDASDNLKGVPSVGEKYALTLIKHFGSLENVLTNSGAVSDPVAGLTCVVPSAMQRCCSVCYLPV